MPLLVSWAESDHSSERLRADLPHLGGAVEPPSPGVRIRAPGDAEHGTAMTDQRVAERSRFRVPHANGALAAPGDETAVRTPGHPPRIGFEQQLGPAQSGTLPRGCLTSNTAPTSSSGQTLATATCRPSGLRAVSIAHPLESWRPPGRWTGPGPGPARCRRCQAADTSDPSALNDGPHASPSPARLDRSLPVEGSHTFSHPSSPVVASIEPSGLNATSFTSMSCPWNEQTPRPSRRP